ncbi:MAG: ABC transporter permease [Bacteroidales bacterium]|nr:MAG: ABC transporter permease [Bacteroidales bacterium]
MNKIVLIVKREYLTRVRKKAFIIMTLIGPILFAAFLIIPAWLATVEDKEEKIIAVIEYSDKDTPVPDSLKQFFDVLTNKDNLKFEYIGYTSLEVLKSTLEHSKYFGILHIPHNVINSEVVELYTKREPSLNMEMHITKSLEKYIHNVKLRKLNIPVEVLNTVRTNIKLKTIKLEKGKYEEKDLKNLRRGVGYAAGFLIYFYIFFFGAQVMRGVIEEKTNRIVELIVSSVRPFQLMMGKIVGIGLLGLTQFVAWIILTFAIVTIAQEVLLEKNSIQNARKITPESIIDAKPVTQQHSKADNKVAEFEGILNKIKGIDFIVMISIFIFYFLGGYILYGSLFAAIGSVVDSETDTQQFMLPVTIPLIISIFVMINAFMNPSGKIAVWFSIIPLTSPIVMMARIPFDVPLTEVITSMVILVLTFLGTTWFAGKIYKTGILMYGKKVNYREIWKWLRYKI